MKKIFLIGALVCGQLVGCAHNNTISVTLINTKSNIGETIVTVGKSTPDTINSISIELVDRAIKLAGIDSTNKILIIDTDKDKKIIYDIIKNHLNKLKIKVTGYNDIAIIIDNEKYKDILGCNTSCMAEIGMALNKDYILKYYIDKSYYNYEKKEATRHGVDLPYSIEEDQEDESRRKTFNISRNKRSQILAQRHKKME